MDFGKQLYSVWPRAEIGVKVCTEAVLLGKRCLWSDLKKKPGGLIGQRLKWEEHRRKS